MSLAENKKQILNRGNSKVQYTPDTLKDRESRLSSEHQSPENRINHHKNLKSENPVKRRVLQPSEFIMKNEDESPMKRMMEKKNRIK